MSGRVVHALNCMVVRPVTDSSAYLSVRQCMMVSWHCLDLERQCTLWL